MRGRAWLYLAALAALAAPWLIPALRRRLGAYSARLLAHWLPDLPAESIDDVVRTGAKWARRYPGRIGPAGSFESMARALWERGRYAEAVSYAEHVLQLRRDLGDRAAEVTALRYLGAAHWYAEDLDAALRQFELAVPLAREHCGPAEEARVRRSLGRLEEDRGEPRAALEWLESSLAIFQALGDEPEEEQVTREDIERVRGEEEQA